MNKIKSSRVRLRKELIQNNFPFDPDIKKEWYPYIISAIDSKGDGKSLQESHLAKEVLSIIGYRSRNDRRIYLEQCILSAAKQLAKTKRVERYNTGKNFRFKLKPQEQSELKIDIEAPIRKVRTKKATSIEVPLDQSDSNEKELPSIKSQWIDDTYSHDSEPNREADDESSYFENESTSALDRFLGETEENEESEENQIELTQKQESDARAPSLSEFGQKLSSFVWNAQEHLYWQGVHSPTKRSANLRVSSNGDIRMSVEISNDEALLLLETNATHWPGYVVAQRRNGTTACHMHLPHALHATWVSEIERQLAAIDEVLDGV